MSYLHSILLLLFGKFSLTELYPTCYECESDLFYAVIHQQGNSYLISVDLRSVFNKESQCPIHFQLTVDKKLSRRKLRRIQSALAYLLKNKDIAGFLFDLPGYDDLGEWTRSGFYSKNANNN